MWELTPEDRAWLKAVHEQGNRNTEAIAAINDAARKLNEAVGAIGKALQQLPENVALANVLLAATGSLCGQIASDAADPHARLEEILASFENGMERILRETSTPTVISGRVLTQLDVLREMAEEQMSTRLEQRK